MRSEINIIKRYNAINELEKASFSDDKSRINIEVKGKELSIVMTKGDDSFECSCYIEDLIDAIWNGIREQ